MNSQPRQAAIKSATDVWKQGVALTDYAFRAQPSNVSAKRERARWRCELRMSVTESVNNVVVVVVVVFCRRLSSSVDCHPPVSLTDWQASKSAVCPSTKAAGFRKRHWPGARDSHLVIGCNPRHYSPPCRLI